MDAHESPALERVRQKPSRARPSVLSVLRVEQAQEEAAAAHPERGCPLRVHTRRTEAGGEGAGGGERGCQGEERGCQWRGEGLSAARAGRGARAGRA